MKRTILTISFLSLFIGVAFAQKPSLEKVQAELASFENSSSHLLVYGAGYSGQVENWFSELDELDEVLLSEDFSTGIPETWTITNHADVGDPTWEAISDPALGELMLPYAAMYPELYGGGNYASSLLTPSINCSEVSSVVLTFNTEFATIAPGVGYETVKVMVSRDGGVTWPDTVYSVLNNLSQYPVEVDLSESVSGFADVIVRFYYADNGLQGRYWAIDDVAIIADPPPSVSVISSPMAAFDDQDVEIVLESTDNSGLGLDTDAMFVYYGEIVGNSVPNPSSVALAATGEENEFSATIPQADLTANADIGWWISISDNAGAEARRPITEGAYYSFHVYPGSYDYMTSQVDYFFTDISETGTALNLEDDDVAVISWAGQADPFPWYSGTFQQCRVSSNGWISFGTPTDSYPLLPPFPSSQGPHNTIAVAGTDLNPETGGAIYWQVLNDRIIIQYDAVRFYNSVQTFTGQIVLVPSTQSVFLNYPTANTAAWAFNHSVGFENNAGLIGHSFEYGTVWNLFNGVVDGTSLLVGVNPAHIEGTITDNEEPPSPLEGVEVSLTVSGDVLQTWTDEEGFYGFYDIVPGNHTIQAAFVDYLPHGPQAVALTGGDTTTYNIQLALDPSADVDVDGYIWVRDEVNVTPVSNVTVYIQLLDLTVTTNESGYFNLGTQPQGVYTFRLTHNTTGSNAFHNVRYQGVSVSSDTTFAFEMDEIMAPSEVAAIPGERSVTLYWDLPTNEQDEVLLTRILDNRREALASAQNASISPEKLARLEDEVLRYSKALARVQERAGLNELDELGVIEGYMVKMDGSVVNSAVVDTFLVIDTLTNFVQYDFEVAVDYGYDSNEYLVWSDPITVQPVSGPRYERDLLDEFVWYELNPDSVQRQGVHATGLIDDGLTPWVSITPNVFSFYEVEYNRFVISSNGYISFTSLVSSVGGSIPDPAQPNAIIAPYWTDLDPGSPTEEVWHWFNQTDSIVVVQWTTGNNPGPEINLKEFQIILDLTDNSFIMSYKHAEDGWDIDQGVTIGVEGQGGVRGTVCPHSSITDYLSVKYEFFDRDFGNITGRVTDGESGVAGALVFASYDRYDVRDTTDVDGYYTLLGVDTAFTYDVVAWAENYAPVYQQVSPDDWGAFTLTLDDLEFGGAGSSPGGFNLVSPGNTSALYDDHTILEWTESVDTDTFDLVHYFVEWSSDVSFAEDVYSATTNNTEYTIRDLLDAFNLNDFIYWRVKAIDLAGNETWSTNGGQAGFVFMLAPSTPPDPFDLVSPANGATTGNTVNFSWNHALEDDYGDSVVYHLEISTSNDPFAATYTYNTGSSVSYTTDQLPDNTQLWWRVLAQDLNTSGTYSNQTWSFNHPPYSSSGNFSDGWNGWYLFSIPAIPQVGQNDTASIIGDDVTGDYAVYSGNSPHQPVGTLSNGPGYWLWLENDATIDMAGSRRFDDYSMTLDDGWNTVGAAMSYEYDVADLKLTDGSDTLTWQQAASEFWIVPSSIGYNPFSGSYEIVSELVPWNGYSLFVVPDPSNPGRELSLITEPVFPDLVMAPVTEITGIKLEPSAEKAKGKTRTTTASTKPKKETDSQNDELDTVNNWFLPVVITQGDMSDELAGIGVNPFATDSIESSYDLPVPPAPASGSYIRIMFLPDEISETWRASGDTMMARDIREPFDNTMQKIWYGFIDGTETGMVELDFSAATDSLPEHFAAYLNLNGQYYNVSNDPFIQFNKTDTRHDFLLTVADEDAVPMHEEEALPTEYAVESIYPNPFNPMTTIQVGLPQASSLRINVFNVLGQEVAQVVNGQYAAGRHRFLFKAENLSSGVYFVHVSAPGKLDTVRKLVLTR